MRRLLLIFFAFFLCFGLNTAYAGFMGHEVTLEYYFPESNILYDTATNTVGAGTEFIDFINYFDLDVSDANVTASMFNSTGFWSHASYNGWVLKDMAADIISVTIAAPTNMVGLDDNRVFFDANSIGVNWQGLDYNTNTIVSLDIEFASVPEPATMFLLGSGLIGLAGFRRKVKKQND